MKNMIIKNMEFMRILMKKKEEKHRMNIKY